MKKIKLGLVILLSLLFAPKVKAQGIKNALGNLKQTGQAAGTGNADLPSIVSTVVSTALSLIGIVLLVLILYGGFMWMTSRGNEEQIGKARKIITSAIIGLAIVLSSYAITVFVINALG
jgi:hypothetical protein